MPLSPLAHSLTTGSRGVQGPSLTRPAAAPQRLSAAPYVEGEVGGVKWAEPARGGVQGGQGGQGRAGRDRARGLAQRPGVGQGALPRGARGRLFELRGLLPRALPSACFFFHLTHNSRAAGFLDARFELKFFFVGQYLRRLKSVA